MEVGFTGTRQGMTPWQQEQLRIVLAALGAGNVVRRFHHGGARGADEQAASLAVDYGYAAVRHEPATWTSDDLLARNREIVAACDLLVAAPVTDREQVRSGTWATVRYARAAGKPVVMLSRGK